jgi:hypothetical protein
MAIKDVLTAGYGTISAAPYIPTRGYSDFITGIPVATDDIVYRRMFGSDSELPATAGSRSGPAVADSFNPDTLLYKRVHQSESELP